MKRRIPLFSLFIAGVIPLLTGCATNALWEDARNDKYQPGHPANLEIFQRGKDNEVLVVYDDQRLKTGAIHRRAYFLRANVDRVLRGKRPIFVPVSLASGMEAIPVVRADSTNTTGNVWAFLTGDNQGFKLVRTGEVERDYPLPVYYDTTKTAFKIALLAPAAFVADAAVVGAVVGAVGAAAYYGGKASPDCDYGNFHYQK